VLETVQRLEEEGEEELRTELSYCKEKFRSEENILCTNKQYKINDRDQ